MEGQLFARKPIEQLMREAGDAEHGLRRTLRAIDLVMIGVGGIIGAGIFVLTGQAAANYAGPGILLSFVLAGIACAFAGLCYSEMASVIPIAGSAYTYSYATMGEFLAWIIGWDLVLEYTMGAATVSVGWSGYVVSFLKNFGIHIPPELSSAPYSFDAVTHTWTKTGAIINVPAILVAVLVTTLLVIGIRESANVNTTIVLIKVVVVITFILAGFAYVNRDNLTPMVPANSGTFGIFGWSGVLRGAGVIFFAYIGFDAVSTAAQEAKNPQRDLPIGIIGSLIVCTILYILVAYVLTGVVHYSKLNVPDPIAVGIDETKLTWLSPIIKIGAIAGLSSVILVMMLGQSRVFWSMANDGLLPKWFSKVHPKFRTPYTTTILTGIVVAVLGGLFPIGILGELVSIGTLFAFVLVCGGVWVMRMTLPDVHRPFKTPLVPVVPILGILSCLYLMAGLPRDTWIRLIVWMAIGLVIYFAYGRSHSKVGSTMQK
jgi:APA family basic amino acid/polyamine antiporter